MLASINPLGERSRNRTWWVTYSWFAAGSVLAGALFGALLGGIGAGLDAWLEPSTTTIAVVAIVLGVVALGFELHVGGLPLPTVRRQVDENWIPKYRAWVYAGGFGFQLGLGVVTVVTTSTVYLTWAFALLTGSIAGGVAIGIVFGIGQRAAGAAGRTRRQSRKRARRAATILAWRAGGAAGGDDRHRARSRRRPRPRARRLRMTDLSGNGVSVTLPAGWEGRCSAGPRPVRLLRSPRLHRSLRLHHRRRQERRIAALDATDPEQLPDRRAPLPTRPQRSSRTPGAGRRNDQHRGARGDDPTAERGRGLRQWRGRTSSATTTPSSSSSSTTRRASHNRFRPGRIPEGRRARRLQPRTCSSGASAARPARRSSSRTAAGRSASTSCSGRTRTGRRSCPRSTGARHVCDRGRDLGGHHQHRRRRHRRTRRSSRPSRRCSSTAAWPTW